MMQLQSILRGKASQQFTATIRSGKGKLEIMEREREKGALVLLDIFGRRNGYSLFRTGFSANSFRIKANECFIKMVHVAFYCLE